MIKMIVCVDNNGGIGRENELLFNIKDDMKFFKETTTGQKVVMGYNTWLSLPKKPLPNRENYVLYNGEDNIEGAEVLRNLDDLVELGRTGVVFVIGGGMVYNDVIAAGIVDEAYITIVNTVTNADVFVDMYELNKQLPCREYIKNFEYGNTDVQLFRHHRGLFYI